MMLSHRWFVRGVGLVLGTCALAPAAWAQSGTETDPPRVDAPPASARVGMLEVSGKVADHQPELQRLLGGGKDFTLRELVDAISEVANDDAMDGLVLRLKDAELNATQAEELGAAIRLARKSGKKVHLFAESLGPTDLMLGSFCDEVIAQDGGPVSLPGLYTEEMYLADTLAWAGLKADFVQVGDYKGASEPLARNAPSPQWDENINQLLDSMYANMREPLHTGRGLSDAALDRAMEELWLAQAADAQAAGLIDSAVDLANLPAHLKEGYGRDVAWKKDLVPSAEGALDLSNPFMAFARLAQKPRYEPDGPTIAVVHIDGAIVDGESGPGGPLGGGSSVGSRTIRNALEDIRKESDIKGVVLRIDSPGGSATASEVIWQGVRRLSEKKPVWVSVARMAASGGYYIAVSGEKIYVNPSSIVGSIGVVGGKISLGDLYGKLHINVVSRGRGPRAHMFASNQPWDEADRADVRAKMAETYELFTRRVAAGRPGIDLSKTAEGRLFTGDKALALKMADEVGGLEDCVADLAESLDLDEYDVMDYPAPRALEEVLKDALGGFMGAAAPAGRIGPNPIVDAIRALVGESVWAQMEPSLTALLLLRDCRVLLVNPRVLIVR